MDVIDFSIAGGGPHTIAPATALPRVEGSVTIDGGLTDPNVIILDGVNAPSATGLDLSTPGANTVRRLAIVRFARGIETGSTGAPNTIELNRIGTNFGNAAGLGNGDGIMLDNEGDLVQDNVIAGNEDFGIFLFTSVENTIVDNRIGTNSAGTAALPNGSGIFTQSAEDNVIGGSAADEGNLISGNIGAGISLSTGEGNRVIGNQIGTNAAGDTAIPNGEDGINISADDSTIGGAGAGEGNVISGNDDAGIDASSSFASGVLIDGNLIGTDASGTAPLPNSTTGIDIAMDGVTVGTTDEGNVISGHDGFSDQGILIGSPFGVTGVTVEGNLIGTAADGLSAIENRDGIRVVGSVDGARIADNLVSGNLDDGIELNEDSFNTVDGTVVQGNQVGNALDGTSLGNGASALEVAEASVTLVGGETAAEANTFNSSGGDGVLVGADAPDTALVGNRVNVNTALGIDLAGGTEDAFGVTANDAGDTDTGANGLQNYPVLAGAVDAGEQTAVAGELDSEPETSYRSSSSGSSGPATPRSRRGRDRDGLYRGHHRRLGRAAFSESLDFELDSGDLATATATELDSSGDPLATSEFAENVTSAECDLTGTENDDPALAGTSADEIICGLGGDDVIDPGGGDDIVVGGDGVDELDLTAGSAAAEVDLVAGTGSVGGDGLGLNGIEDVLGTDFADVLTGDDAENTLAGRAGGDTLDGGDDGDTLKGGDDRDTVRGKAGPDDLRGQEGIDELVGGDAGDELDGGDSREDDLKGNAGKDSFDGGAGDDDSCNGGDNNDETPARDCEIVRSIP